MTGTITEIEQLSKALNQVAVLLKKESVVWPYQKLSLEEFARKYFPQEDSRSQIEKFKNLPPEKFLKAVENQLRAVDAILGPLEDRLKALEFQHSLLSFFSIFLPKKLGECRKILKKTPREIREGFTTEKNLDLAIKKGFTQKAVAEVMALWLNMRYYGALSCGLSPKFLITSVKDSESLKTKLKTITETLDQLRPNVEDKHEEYSKWVFRKQHIDEERKLMTFGPESIKTLETVLNSVYHLSLAGELSQEEAMNLVDKVKEVIEESIKIGISENKKLIPKEKREILEEIIKTLSEKPRLYFIIAQISNFLKHERALTREHITTLHKILDVIQLLPETTTQAVEREDLKENLQIIFEPLKYQIVGIDKKGKKKSKTSKLSSRRSGTTEAEGDFEQGLTEKELLKKIFDDTSRWFVARVIDEKKQGLETLLELFNGIPVGLGTHIALMIMKGTIKIDIDKFKECLIGYLGHTGVYELYGQIGKRYKEEAEIEVADEINIPPQADQRLAPIQKQIRFEFMKYMETSKLNKTPLFNILETHQIPPINLVNLLLEVSQSVLVEIINYNAERKLHQLVEVDPKEFEVKLKTLHLKLTSLMKKFQKTLEELVLEELKKRKFDDRSVFEQFSLAIKEIWIKSLVEAKKIEPEEVDITTSKVSALAAKLEGGSRKPISSGSRAAPPRAASPSAANRPPPSAAKLAPPSNKKIAVPRRAAPPSLTSRPTPPSARGRPAPPSSTVASPSRIEPPSSKGKQKPPALKKSKGAVIQPKKEELGPKLIDVNSLEELQDIEIVDNETLTEVPDFVKRAKEPKGSSKLKTAQLKETIEEAMRLVEDSMDDLDKLSPHSLKNALQLVYQLREIEKGELTGVDPNKIRQVADIAESLKKNKESIVIQKEKLNQLKTRLSERALLALESKLELIAKLFDDFIQELETRITQLLEKGEILIKHYRKKGGKAFRARQQLKRERKDLAQQVDILKKIGDLPSNEFEQVKELFRSFQMARKARQNKLIKKFSVQICEIIKMNRKRFLKLTRDPKLKKSLKNLLKKN